MKSRKGLILWQVEWNLINYKSPSGRVSEKERDTDTHRERIFTRSVGERREEVY